MAKIIHEVQAVYDTESERGLVTCPNCKRPWCSIIIQTSAGWLYDPVECDCGAELIPTEAVIKAFCAENKPDETWPFTRSA